MMREIRRAVATAVLVHEMDGLKDSSECCRKNGPYKGHPNPPRRILLLYRCIKVLPLDIDLYDPIPPKKAAGIDLNWKMFPSN
jgi:hypothetical protein